MRNHYLGLLLLALVLFSNTVFAQEPCYFEQRHEEMLQTNPSFKKAVENNERLIQSYLRLPQNVYRSTYNIPVVVHVIHLGEAVGVGNNISDAQINSAIDRLNDVYTNVVGISVDTDIQFSLATRKYDCTATTGIVRVDGTSVTDYSTEGIDADGDDGLGADEVSIKDLSRWNPEQYLNIWVVSEIDDNDGGAGVQGYAYYPGASYSRDGVVMLNSAFGYDPTELLGYTLKSYTNKNTTFVHEVAHTLGIYHSFNGDNDGASCPDNTDCNTNGDFVCDTDPHIRTSSCVVGTNACNGGTPLADIVDNFMNYSDQNCRDRFTSGQAARMQATLSTTRAALNNSYGNQSIDIAEPADICVSTTSNTSNSTGIGITKVTIGGLVFGSGNTVEDGGFVDNWCADLTLDANTLYNIEVITGNANDEDVRIYLDYDGDGDLSDGGEEIFSSDGVRTTHTGSFTTPASPSVTGTPLRLRVVSDFENYTISGPCYDPEYGQAEDFSITMNAALPVELISFTGELNNKLITLNWQTASEINNAGFVILKSVDGRDWDAIGEVVGAGNSLEILNYQFTDVQPLIGNNYYKLLQKDFDGTIDHSNVIIVNYNNEYAIQLFPNPTSGDQFFLEMTSLNTADLNLQIFSATGQLILNKKESIQKGYNKLSVDISKLLAGAYYVRINQLGKIQNFRLVKMGL